MFRPQRKGKSQQETKEVGNAVELVRHSGYFDAEWYARTYQVEEDPLEHFMKNFQTNNPSRHFSVARYYAEYKGVAKRGLNPLVHYLRHGRYEGRTAFPTDDLEAILSRKEIFEKKNSVSSGCCTCPAPENRWLRFRMLLYATAAITRLRC